MKPSRPFRTGWGMRLVCWGLLNPKLWQEHFAEVHHQIDCTRIAMNPKFKGLEAGCRVWSFQGLLIEQSLNDMWCL